MSADVPITRTKVVIPRRRSDLLSRPRLLSALDDLLDCKLLIIAAPAGYGKTSLLIDYAAQSNLPVCWFSLESLDQDPLRFIAHFISAIQVRFSSFGRSSMAALKNNQENLNLEVLVTNIVNDLYEHVTEHFAIVLDDYHLVASSKSVDAFINRFVQDVDENCHLVLASRSLLTLPDLPIMVARSQVGGLSFEELTFRLDEVRELLEKRFDRKISDEEASEMLHRSEGWITGLLLSTQVSNDQLDDRLRVTRVTGVGLYDYLAQQVLEQQPPEIQTFLLRSSLLEEFDASLCQDVIVAALHLGDTDCQAMISYLLRSNLFVLPVGEDHVYLRYHHLFQAFLQARMQSLYPDEVQRIRTRLAEVHIERREWERAHSLYTTLDQPLRIADVIEQAGMNLIITGRQSLLSSWIDALPPQIVSRRPALLSLQGSGLVLQGKTEQGLALLNQAIAGLDSTADPIWSVQALLRRSSTHRLLGHYQAALEDVDVVLNKTQANPELRVYWAEAMRARGLVLYYHGRMREALADMQAALVAYQEMNDEEHASRIMMEVGMVERNLGNDMDAEQAYIRSLKFWETTKNSVWQANLLNNLGVLQHLRGDYEAAAASFESAIEHGHMAGNPRMEAYALTSVADLYRDLDAAQQAREAYQTAREIAQRIKDQFLLYYLHLAEGVVARVRGRLGPARQSFMAASSIANEADNRMQQHLVCLELGAVKLLEKQPAEAKTDLETAAAYFAQTGQRIEAARAHLLAALACHALKETNSVNEHLEKLSLLIPNYAQRSPLLLNAREFRPALEEIAARKDSHLLAGEIIRLIDEFEEQLPRLRRLLRRRAISVPFAPPRLVIHALGKMDVKVNDHLVSTSEWKTQSVRDLFFLFLNHPEGLTKEQVGEILWPESSTAELRLRFKNDIYRLRHAVGKDTIAFFDEVYRFNPDLDYEYDLETFQREIAQAQSSTTLAEKISHYRAAVRCYKGDFLPEVNETWVIRDREHLYNQYITALLRLAELSIESRQFDSAFDYCQRALALDPCLEEAYRLMMQAYDQLGNRAGILRAYEQCKSALHTEVGVLPSPQTQRLYERFMR